MRTELIHRNVEERSDAAGVTERGLKSLIFVAGPAVLYLIVVLIIGLPFFGS